jgi:Uma2 family endonuclease
MSNAATVICQRHRLTVAEYYRMAEVGILSPEARVELIEGEVIDMPPIGSLHTGTVIYLANRLTYAVRDKAIV